jgi:hypothetical protein
MRVACSSAMVDMGGDSGNNALEYLMLCCGVLYGDNNNGNIKGLK